MNLIELIRYEMDTDVDDMDKQSRLAIDTYKNAGVKARKAVDEVMTCVCGWTMQSLIDKMKD
jgi:hypothetical protein